MWRVHWNISGTEPDAVGCTQGLDVRDRDRDGLCR